MGKLNYYFSMPSEILAVKDSKISDKNSEVNKDQIGSISIQKLQSTSVTIGDIKKLNEIGIYSIEALVRTPKKDLVSVKGLSVVKVEQILKEATKMVHMGFHSTKSIYEQRKEIIHITTGSKKFDELLNGGIETGSITEIYGENGCGKTQLCFTLAVTCQLPVEKGGGEGKCLWIDAGKGDFSPERLIQIASRFGLNPEVCLDNIAYAKAYTTDHQTQLLVTAASLMADSRFALLIVDSVIALYRIEYPGRGELNARQIHLGGFLRALQKIAEDRGAAIVITNQVVANLDCGSLFPSSSIKPCGGYVMAHSPRTRISISKSKGVNRKVKIVQSSSLPKKDGEIAIGIGGVEDCQKD